MQPLDDHLERIRLATWRDWKALLEHFAEQCDPMRPSELRPVRPGRVPDIEWDNSPECSALTRMLARCWPSERSQRQ
jgi:hypothetical protein